MGPLCFSYTGTYFFTILPRMTQGELAKLRTTCAPRPCADHLKTQHSLNTSVFPSPYALHYTNTPPPYHPYPPETSLNLSLSPCPPTLSSFNQMTSPSTTDTSASQQAPQTARTGKSPLRLQGIPTTRAFSSLAWPSAMLRSSRLPVARAGMQR